VHSPYPNRSKLQAIVTPISKALIPIGFRIKNESVEIIDLQLKQPTSRKISLIIASSFLILLMG